MTVLLYVGALFLALFVYGLRPVNWWRHRSFPGPKPSWLIGSAAAIFGTDQIFMFQKWMQKFGPKPFAVSLGATSMVVISDPDDVRAVLLHSPNRPDLNVNSVVPRDNDPSDSMIWARGEKWRSLKAAWQPLFFSGSLKGYKEIMDGAADLLVEEVKEHVEGKEKYFNIYPMIQAMTMDVIGQTGFGIKLQTQKCDKTVQSEDDRKRSTSLLKAAKTAIVPNSNSVWVILASLFPFLVTVLRPLAKRFPDPLLRDFVKGDKFIDRVVFGLLDDHQAAVKADPYSKPLRLAIGAEPNINQSAVEHEEPEQQHFLPAKLSNGSNGMTTNAIVQSDEADKENASTLNVANGSQTGVSSADGTKPLNDGKLTHVPEIRKGVQPGSFIDLLVRGSMRDTGELFTHNEKAQQVLTLLLGGYDTTANSLSTTIYSLARSCHADIQRRLIQEVDALGSKYSYEDLETKVPYMDAVIKESLRLYPPGHLLFRETSEDLKLKDCILPKGTFAGISAYGIHHEKAVWGNDVEDFIPDRWLTEDAASQKRAKNGYFAFGAGPRACPGNKFALLEIKCTLIKIFPKFTLELAPNQEPLQLRVALTLGPMNGVFVRAIPRAGAN